MDSQCAYVCPSTADLDDETRYALHDALSLLQQGRLVVTLQRDRSVDELDLQNSPRSKA
jgi:hypothetical protein